MALIEAIEDLKAELEAGKSVDAVIEQIAEDHDLKPVFLRNRAIAAIGDLDNYAERAAAAREANKSNIEGAKRKIALSRVKAQIEAHNAGTARVSDGQLRILIAAANELGANYQLVQRGQRLPATPAQQFERDMRRLIKMLMA
ncbi:hypothetical protein CC53_gp097 [Rhizobium phage vB_RleS_L338C]|uniref:hypothetical protein n=1 Tax=Rhizobium phage vB_RleS_L338C TaxID=1414737 RepID=UPI0003D92482|nr:hypothetical protein CC53_gp097 [Rhizobium phage vB_RleS_L338C]AHC30514.1 hypothetical protein L338C_097 [Rhizobium phage vB_RleS_L338C]QNH72113.1 hypothetical protein P11VFA_053 [Rhizobium phage P11VFA]